MTDSNIAPSSNEHYTVEPVYSANHGYAAERPYIVRVNGKTLLNNQHSPRRFKDSMKAAVAGAKEVDRMKAQKRTLHARGSIGAGFAFFCWWRQFLTEPTRWMRRRY